MSVPDTAVSFLLDNLVQRLVYKSNLVKDMEDSIKELQKDLTVLESLTKDFAKYDHDSDYLKLFYKEIKSIIDDAEDVVDTYVLQAAVQKSQPWICQKFHFMDYHFKLRAVGKKIQNISYTIKKVYMEKAKAAYEILQYQATGKFSKPVKPKEDPKVEEEHVVGFDDAITKVIQLVSGGSEQLEVISIVGMQGLGKTTLAKKVFKHPAVDFEYMIRVFVYVSKEYESREVFLKILSSFTKIDDEVNMMSHDSLAEHLCKNLEGKQYLIVLDDVWEKKDWDRLKHAFPNNYKRCRVLITTCHERVAEHAKNSNTPFYKLGFLPDDTSRELLRWKIFRDNNLREDIDNYVQQIAKKCDGLPLAIVVIAGVIANYADRVEWWKHVANSVEEYMVRDQSTEVIELMYKHLPNYLKLCFLYLGVFPEDFEIPVWKLVRLWMAEGLIRQEEITLDLEDIAEQHLDELIYRNLVIVGRRRSNGKVKTCTVHDTLREFCKKQAKQENLFQEIKKDNLASFLNGESTLDQCRRLCINNVNVVDFISSPPPGKCIRSLLTFAKEETGVEPKRVSPIPKTLRLLRVLEIQALKFTRFPIDLNHLVLLKYIAISSKFSSLPETMSALWNMQTLIVNTESTTLEIKADIWKLPQLRHLHTNTSALLPCPDSKNQKKKNEVIQTLSTISPESCTREILGRTGKLKKLGIRGTLTKLFEISGGSPLFDNLKDLASLENLKLVNDNFESSIASLPSEKSFPQQLTNLSLSGTQLYWKEMAKLGKLENLEILKLKEHAFKGKMWQTAHGGFLRLKHLHVGTTDLEDWEASADHFPGLKCLELNGCDKLKAVPAGFSDISSLQSVNLHCTNTLVVSSAKRLQAENEKKSRNFKLSVYPPDHLKGNPKI